MLVSNVSEDMFKLNTNQHQVIAYVHFKPLTVF